MAVTTAVCDSFKREILSGSHLTSHVYKIALIKAASAGTFNSGTTSYTQLSTDEVTGAGYTAGGNTLSGLTITVTTNTASMDWADTSWSSASISAEGAMIYNATLSTSASLGVFSFGGTVTSTSGTFSVTIPSAGTGVIRIA
jgi:hypothetical protein